MVKGKDPHRGPVAAHPALPVRRPMDLLQLGVVAQIRPHYAAPQKELQFSQRRIGRGAAMPADGKGAAGIGVFQRRRPIGPVQPPLHQPGKKPVARAQHIEDLDRKARPGLAVIQTVGDRTLKCHRALGAALADQRRARDRADIAQRLYRVGGAAGNVELFLGADDQVEQMQRRLKFGGDGGAFDKAAFAVAMPRHAPEVRAIVDIQRGLGAMLARQFQRLEHRSGGAGVRQMRAGGQHRARLGNETLVDILFAQRHVGAVLAIEDQRELFLVTDTQNDQRGQPLGVGGYAARIDALAGKLLADEAAHMLVADAGDHRRFQPQPRRPAGDIRRRAADILGKRPHILKTATNLRPVKVNRRTPNRDHIQRLHHTLSIGPARQTLARTWSMLARSAASGSASSCTSAAKGSKLNGPS